MKTLQELLALNPELHLTGDGESTSYGLLSDALSFIDKRVVDGSRTLETGAGLSTILFAMKGAFHISIMPDQKLADRIVAFCASAGISTERLRFIVGCSQDALPGIDAKDLDFVLIDGDHAFPMPFIDWYYTANLLKVGGVVLVDDTQIWTGDVLKQYLLKEPSWSIERDFSNSAVFQKLRSFENLWWGQQQYVVRQSRALMRIATTRRVCGKACELVKQREFGQLVRKLINFRPHP